MILFNYHYFYYYFGLFLIVHARYLLAYKCHECNGMTFNYSITIDNIPSPTKDDCVIVTAENGCSVRIGWFDDGTSEVYYDADPELPFDSVVAKIERKVTIWSGEYVTNRFIGYNCKSANTTPCNTVDNLKLAIISTILPTDEQIEKFDSLIVPTTEFFGSLCLQFSNMTNCPETNIPTCQQCINIVQYSEQLNICAMCPAGKAVTNFIDYYTTFFLNNQTHLDRITLTCRKYGACNSIANIERIKSTLVTKFDFDKVFRSTASIIKSSIIILFVMFTIGLLHADYRQ
ncbi:unnamed protein product [Rotaria sp. Silwood2]|nr:unnamed protein product [Rotaria sp. Silwood2]CAF2858270.1 unnamed protein product [Rotaria sp. Silwood2]CAF3086723.1 unnamed protein product [Rotaria sp. Silwood2]CAF4037448.1 unnamed protein product [Rotaria sp. Silwood2]CAF4165835.1 unnamed protein product [Rotaria sp. Silwood2]